MYEEEVATLNGHAESPVFAPTESAEESALWGVHEEIWAHPAEAEVFEDMLTENPGQELAGFENTATALPNEYAQPEASPFGERPYDQGAHEESAFETPYSEDTSFEDTAFENPTFENPTFEDTTFEDTSFEDTASQSIHAANESAYEDTSQEEADESAITAEWAAEDVGYEQTGYEQTGYEDVGYESLALENGVTETYESTVGQATESAGALNPELLEWPGEVYAEDWAASGEASASVEQRFGMAEQLHEDGPGAQVSAGERTVSNHPLLRAHRGTQPDLVVRWNTMPRSTTAVDVVVHLHGYSGSGARMKIQDKAAASGLVLGSPSGDRRTRPTLGLVPRGNFFGGQSGAGYNFPELVTPGAISRLVASGLDLLRAQTGVQAQLGRLILTAHSGGGAPLNAILRHTDADEVHLFDGSYGDMANVVSWAKRRIARGASGSALRVLFRPGTGTAKHALAIAAGICPTISASPDAAAVHRRFRVESTSVEHNLIPSTFGPLLLADPGADVPGAVRRGCVHGGGAPSSAPTTPSGPGTSPPTTRTPDRVAGIVKVTPYAKDGTHALPGAVALAGQWRRLTGRRAGTFVPRNTSFGARSIHSEGRAIDCHGFVSKPAEAAQAEAYIRWLMANAVELQVATIIWNRQIWSWTRRAQGWRSYMTKPNHNPHTDHFHVDLSWEGALHPSPLFAGAVPGLGGAAAPTPAAPTRASRAGTIVRTSTRTTATVGEEAVARGVRQDVRSLRESEPGQDRRAGPGDARAGRGRVGMGGTRGRQQLLRHQGPGERRPGYAPAVAHPRGAQPAGRAELPRGRLGHAESRRQVRLRRPRLVPGVPVARAGVRRSRGVPPPEQAVRAGLRLHHRPLPFRRRGREGGVRDGSQLHQGRALRHASARAQRLEVAGEPWPRA